MSSGCFDFLTCPVLVNLRKWFCRMLNICDGVSVSYIPDDLITEILLRLPVKSILKFRCVSKSWLCLISSKQFVQLHLEFSTKHPNFVNHNLVLSQFGSRGQGLIEQYSLNSLLYKESTDVKKLHYPKTSDDDPNYEAAILLGSCNGICCIAVKRELFLWNPATRKSKILPCFCGTVVGRILLDQRGFGFVDDDEYKVFIKFHKSANGAEKRVHLYRSRTNSWNTVDNFFQVCTDNFGVFANKNLHWVDIHGRNIVYFDLKREEHGVIDPPTEFKLCVKPPPLGVFGEYLCVHCNHKTHMDVWILKQYGRKDQYWSKLVSVRYDDHPAWSSRISNPTLVFITWKGEILTICQTGELSITWMVYDPKYKSLKDYVGSKSDDKISPGQSAFKIRASVYIQSLVSIP